MCHRRDGFYTSETANGKTIHVLGRVVFVSIAKTSGPIAPCAILGSVVEIQAVGTLGKPTAWISRPGNSTADLRPARSAIGSKSVDIDLKEILAGSSEVRLSAIPVMSFVVRKPGRVT